MRNKGNTDLNEGQMKQIPGIRFAGGSNFLGGGVETCQLFCPILHDAEKLVQYDYTNGQGQFYHGCDLALLSKGGMAYDNRGCLSLPCCQLYGNK